MINFDAHYRVKGFRGFAFSLLGYAINVIPGGAYIDEDGYEYEEESISTEDESHVRAVMVGDDKIHIVAVADLTEISEEDFCHSCGQIGCKC